MFYRGQNSYQYPGYKTYQTFLIEKDFSIIIYDVEYETKVKKILEKYQVQNDGTIKKIFSYRKKVDNSNYSAPNWFLIVVNLAQTIHC